MKKKLLSIILAVVMIVGMIPLGTLTAFAVPVDLSQYDWEGVVGDGTEGKPYKIGSKDDLEKLAEIVNAGTNCTDTYFVLTDDIGSTNDPVTTTIGSAANIFNGHFNGDGHTVTVELTDTWVEYYALFSVLGNGGEIINLTTAGCVPCEGNKFSGGVCGYNYGTITNCCNTAKVSGDSESFNIGGVCGYNNGTIANCRNTAEVNGTENVGGVCGQNNGTITNCCNTGTVSAESYAVGGVCGTNNGTITNCCNTGEVSGSNNVGGVCGYSDYNNNNKCTITNCYNTGTVSGSDYVGGVCGHNFGGNVCATITNCYNTGTVSSEYGDAGGVCGYNWDTIANCYNTGTVSGIERVGGVCGENRYTITYCYYDKDAYKGNVVGRNEGGTTDYCYGLSATQMKAESKAVLTTSVANDKPLVVLLNEYVTAHSSDNLRPWANKQDEYPVFGTPHTHAFTYSADGDTLIAACSADGCDLKDNKISLTLGEDGKYSEKALKAWTDAGAAAPEIKYYEDKDCKTAKELTGKEVAYSVKASVSAGDVTVSAKKRVVICGFDYSDSEAPVIVFALPFETESYPLSNLIVPDEFASDGVKTGMLCYTANGEFDVLTFSTDPNTKKAVWINKEGKTAETDLAKYAYFIFFSNAEGEYRITLKNPSTEEKAVPAITVDYLLDNPAEFPTLPGNYLYYFGEGSEEMVALKDIFCLDKVEKNVSFDIFEVQNDGKIASVESGSITLEKPTYIPIVPYGVILTDRGEPCFEQVSPQLLNSSTLYVIHVHSWEVNEDGHKCVTFEEAPEDPAEYLHLCSGECYDCREHLFDGLGKCVACNAIEIPQGQTLIYNGMEQYGVPQSPYYDIVDNMGTDAATYEATATIRNGYVWEDGSTDEQFITWSIAERVVTLSGEFDGEFGERTYASFDEAMTALGGATGVDPYIITLVSDVVCETTGVFPGNENIDVILDLNGHKLICDESAEYFNIAFRTMSITDSSDEGTGTVEGQVVVNGQLTIENGTFEDEDGFEVISGELIINGGRFKFEPNAYAADGKSFEYNDESCYYELATQPADLSALAGAFEEALPIDAALYEADDALNTFCNLRAAAQMLLDEEPEGGYPGSKQDEIDDLVFNLTEAQKSITLKDADYTDVDEAIAKADSLDKTLYTEESLDPLTAAILAVDRTKKIDKQYEVRQMADRINEAIENLEYKNADYDALNAAISAADEITDPTLYTAESWVKFRAARDNAKNISGDLDIRYQSKIIEAEAALTLAAESLVKLSKVQYNMINEICEYDGLMARQGKIIDGVTSDKVGRTIIPLTKKQIEDINEYLWVVGFDGTKEFRVKIDCAYTYFYDGTEKIEAGVTPGLEEYAAFIIIDNDGTYNDDNTISGYGYYRIYNGEVPEDEEGAMLDTLYLDPKFAEIPKELRNTAWKVQIDVFELGYYDAVLTIGVGSATLSFDGNDYTFTVAVFDNPELYFTDGGDNGLYIMIEDNAVKNFTGTLEEMYDIASQDPIEKI